MRKNRQKTMIGPKLGETNDGPGKKSPKCQTSTQIAPKTKRASHKSYSKVETFLIKTAMENVIFQRKCDFWTNMMEGEEYSYP
jgi:hypothetical protein